MSELISVCDIKWNKKAGGTGRTVDTSCAGPLALFHLRHWRVDFKLVKQGGSSCPKHVSSKSKSHFLSLLQNWCSRGQMRRMRCSPFGDWVVVCSVQMGAMLAGGKALADCLCRRFFRPSATWPPSHQPLLRSSYPAPCLPTPALHRPLAS